MRKYRGNPDDNIMHMAVDIAWSNTKDALKEYINAYSIEDVMNIYDKQLFAVSGTLPNGLLKKRRLKFHEILQSNDEFKKMKLSIESRRIQESKTNNYQLNIFN